MLKALARLGVAAQARLILVLAAVSLILAIAGGTYVFSLYEEFRRHYAEVEVPLLSRIAAANVELGSIQQDLLALIDKAKHRAVDEETVYREGRRLVDRTDALLDSFPEHILSLAKAEVMEVKQLQTQAGSFRGDLVLAVEMLSVNLGLAEMHAQRVSRDALIVNRNAAELQQTINEHLTQDALDLGEMLFKLVLPMTAIVLAVVAAALLLLRYLAGNISTTFGQLQQTLGRLRAGDTAVPVASEAPGTESADIAASLEAFRKTLIERDAMRSNLEREVEDRTDRLRLVNKSLSEQVARLYAAEQDLRLFKKVFESITEAIVVTELDGTIIDVNDAYVDITGYAHDEVVGQNPRITSSGQHDARFYQEMWREIREKGYWTGEIWDRRRSGEIYPKLLSISTVYDDARRPLKYVGVFTDISGMKETEKQLEQLAYFDRLTGLPNRRLLLDRVEHAIALARRNGNVGAIFFLDLDRFKHVNDTLGHNAGDQLLIEVARRLQECVRTSDTVGRLAGDEFLVLAEELSDDGVQATRNALVIGEKIVAALGMPYQLDGKEVITSSSVGITLFDSKTVDNVDSLLSKSDTAMYEAKRTGRGRLCFFDPGMQESYQSRVALENRLRTAVHNRDFSLHFQPQFEGASRVIGLEALLRWNDNGQAVSPAQFIPLAEEIHLIDEIGRWVLEETCRLLKEWEVDPQLANIPISINVSGKQFNNRDFVAETWDTLRRHGIAADRLKLELTESIVVENVEASIAKMEALQSFGIRLSMDDFGVGYSSLAYLRRLPFDQIKIDRSFVNSMLEDQNDLFIVHTVLTMARLMQVEVIAEGVETAEQHEALSALGCELFQGYLFSRPLPAADCRALILASTARH
jgi:diguanylate cyclase (GGDEF)-like protein/PAS domain S-box-containing protein